MQPYDKSHASIIVDDNFISGTFPQELGQLSLLQALCINGNRLTGTLPTQSWEHMPNLTVLNIGGNSGGNALTGTYCIVIRDHSLFI